MLDLSYPAGTFTPENGLRAWVIINEVPEGNWGAAGNVVQYEQLRQAAADERAKAGDAALSAS
jgi:hypothetical protein